MEKVRLYFVKTNADYFIAAKHENCTMILNNNNNWKIVNRSYANSSLFYFGKYK